jgi:hypothetical protein
VRLHPVVHDAAAETTRNDAEGAQDRHGHEQHEDPDQHVGADLAGVEGGDQHVLRRPAEDPRVGHGEHAEQHGTEGGDDEHARLAAYADPEDAEPVEGRGAPLLRIFCHPARLCPATNSGRITL